MTQENIKLLLKDIFARIPYGVKGINSVGNISSPKDWKTEFTIEMAIKHSIAKYDWRPYLFPQSSMTNEQKEEYLDLVENQYRTDANGNIFTLQDFYCKYHIDYRGLIPKGIAIDCTDLNIY